MALTGQTPSQEQHLMQTFGSITALPFLSEIAPTGQMFTHVPQPIHCF